MHDHNSKVIASTFIDISLDDQCMSLFELMLVLGLLILPMYSFLRDTVDTANCIERIGVLLSQAGYCSPQRGDRITRYHFVE